MLKIEIASSISSAGGAHRPSIIEQSLPYTAPHQGGALPFRVGMPCSIGILLLSSTGSRMNLASSPTRAEYSVVKNRRVHTRRVQLLHYFLFGSLSFTNSLKWIDKFWIQENNMKLDVNMNTYTYFMWYIYIKVNMLKLILFLWDILFAQRGNHWRRFRNVLNWNWIVLWSCIIICSDVLLAQW